MKIAITLMLFSLMISNFVFQKERKNIILEGKYRMEYEPEYAHENCNVNINNNKYVKTVNNSSKTQGTIAILKHKYGQEYIMRDKKSDIEMIVEGTTYRPSDTIFFRTKNINEKESDDELTISAGKLIKIK